MGIDNCKPCTYYKLNKDGSHCNHPDNLKNKYKFSCSGNLNNLRNKGEYKELDPYNKSFWKKLEEAYYAKG